MRYLVDTDWVIHALRGAARVADRLEQLAPEGIGLSIISLAELYEGIFFSPDPEAGERALHDFLRGIEVLPVDDAVCRIFAKERGRLRAAGTLITDFDLLIGATAVRHNLTLLTDNRRHFERIAGLDILPAT